VAQGNTTQSQDATVNNIIQQKIVECLHKEGRCFLGSFSQLHEKVKESMCTIGWPSSTPSVTPKADFWNVRS